MFWIQAPKNNLDNTFFSRPENLLFEPFFLIFYDFFSVFSLLPVSCVINFNSIGCCWSSEIKNSEVGKVKLDSQKTRPLGNFSKRHNQPSLSRFREFRGGFVFSSFTTNYLIFFNGFWLEQKIEMVWIWSFSRFFTVFMLSPLFHGLLILYVCNPCTDFTFFAWFWYFVMQMYCLGVPVCV